MAKCSQLAGPHLQHSRARKMVRATVSATYYCISVPQPPTCLHLPCIASSEYTTVRINSEALPGN